MVFPRLNYRLLFLTLAGITALFWAGTRLTTIDTDITRYLPRNDPVLHDAGYVFAHHPIQGEMAIDLAVETAAPDLLARHGDLVEKRLRESGLFRNVGTESMQSLIPDLITHITENLPVLFTRAELENEVGLILSPDRITARLEEIQRQLLNLDAIGQSRLISSDPLGLHRVVMSRLSLLAPSRNIEFYRGKLLSADRKHLLIVASPIAPGTDTAFALKLETLLQTLATELAELSDPGNPVTLTPMGAYRAALDNERMAKDDVQDATVFSTIGIGLLLLLVFPRPLIGLFSFLPAVAGTVAAFFVMALLHEQISIMAVGFGGAIISITVDQGMAYLLFLDQSQTTHGHEVSEEIWGMELMVTLTTVGAFYALCLTGFPILSQLGQFAAMGAAFSFLFVHFIFPAIFPQMPPARPRALPFREWVGRLTIARPWAAMLATAFFIGMLFFARPVFITDLAAMNTVSPQTAAAEKLMGRVWGSSIFSKIYLMNEAPLLETLQADGDRILSRIEEDIPKGVLASGFSPAMIFPGPERARQNFSAWKAFWTPERIRTTEKIFTVQAEALGFEPEIFEFFRKLILSENGRPEFSPIPEKYFSLMGISKSSDGIFRQFSTLTAGESHNAADFVDRYGKTVRIFDPILFSQRLGSHLFNTFAKMMLVAGSSVAVLIFFFLLSPKLTAITLAPAVFAQVCTMGTLKLIGHPLDIPSLMLAIIIMGMGVDYALLLVCSYQRYGGLNEPGCERIKMAAMLAALATLIGFGVLCTADHSLLRSAGVTSFLGIGYSLIGAFVLLPPLLEHHFKKSGADEHQHPDWRKRVLARYRDLETYPRLFARFKLRNDPLFSELPGLLNGSKDPSVVLDIGCGFGLPGCAILELFPKAVIYGIDPDRERVRVANRAFGNRGNAQCDLAPNVPSAPEPADIALLLDMIHFLDDAALQLTLEHLRNALRPEGHLVIRAVIPPPDHNVSLHWRFDAFKLRMAKLTGHYRSVSQITDLVESQGFKTLQTGLSGSNPESAWVVAVRPPS